MLFVSALYCQTGKYMYVVKMSVCILYAHLDDLVIFRSDPKTKNDISYCEKLLKV